MTKPRKRPALRSIAIAAALASMGINSAATAAVTCSGPVNYVRVSSDGVLSLDWGWSTIPICSLDTNDTYGGETYTPADCQRVQALAMTAFGTGNDLSFRFSTGTDCSAILTVFQSPSSSWSNVTMSVAP